MTPQIPADHEKILWTPQSQLQPYEKGTFLIRGESYTATLNQFMIQPHPNSGFILIATWGSLHFQPINYGTQYYAFAAQNHHGPQSIITHIIEIGEQS